MIVRRARPLRPPKKPILIELSLARVSYTVAVQYTQGLIQNKTTSARTPNEPKHVPAAVRGCRTSELATAARGCARARVNPGWGKELVSLHPTRACAHARVRHISRNIHMTYGMLKCVYRATLAGSETPASRCANTICCCQGAGGYRYHHIRPSDEMRCTAVLTTPAAARMMAWARLLLLGCCCQWGTACARAAAAGGFVAAEGSGAAARTGKARPAPFSRARSLRRALF